METKKKGEVFPLVKGYELVAEIGGGGFSVCALCSMIPAASAS